ncbi:MAG: BadF/BadG/BcrA/BcrD ATPase family protein [Propionicimonas sp.]|uniref:N-acetylglucosamine kinase n=1 Tax=Propionicimonas sp. TaxID=1955623 RepID=UPI002B21FD7F|nr:BadF/BadG/BcrA/BcrD ATPase family protein [Propionicimonas sp.]MEA4943426.1 BadF/BadG/BcrA/BcrD ATPase family protein [Propionicimonas sp.]
MRSAAAEPVVVAVDGGGSKTDAVATTLDGTVVGQLRGPGSSPHLDDLGWSVRIVDDLVRAVADGRQVRQANLYLSGIDLPSEIDVYRARLASLPWAGESTVVDNDLYALLRAGTDAPDAVAVVCGTGMNAIGVRADGAEVRFPALGEISGDWGGGGGLGAQVLWHAARDADGRGPATLLTAGMLERLGADSVASVIEDFHLGRRCDSELAGLPPLVFEAAAAGDPVARGLVDRQAEEIVAFVRACLHRLELFDRPVPVVLGGGIIAAHDPLLMAAIHTQLAALSPLARAVVVAAPPILGGIQLALTAAGCGADALARARSGLGYPDPRG